MTMVRRRLEGPRASPDDLLLCATTGPRRKVVVGSWPTAVMTPEAVEMTTLIRDVDRGELEARRATILRRAGIDRAELEARAAAGTLSDEEWEAWDALSGVEFLLDDSRC